MDAYGWWLIDCMSRVEMSLESGYDRTESQISILRGRQQAYEDCFKEYIRQLEVKPVISIKNTPSLD